MISSCMHAGRQAHRGGGSREREREFIESLLNNYTKDHKRPRKRLFSDWTAGGCITKNSSSQSARQAGERAGASYARRVSAVGLLPFGRGE